MSASKATQKIVIFGGGTGLSNALKGLIEVNEPSSIFAIPSVWDDGGSSGRLRDERGSLPPGDTRQCVVSSVENPHKREIAQKLFDDRLADISGPFKGHSLGNLIFERLELIYHGPDRAIEALSALLDIKVHILLHTLTELRLIAKTQKGIEIQGETNIDLRKMDPQFNPADRISRLYFNTKPEVNKEVLDAIKKADKIVFSAGDLYTSVLPHLLMQETRHAILKSKAPLLFILNLMTKSGETDHYKASDHLKSFLSFLYNSDDENDYKDRLDFMVVNDNGLDQKIVDLYKEKEGQEPVIVDEKACEEISPHTKLIKIKKLGRYYHEVDLLRHDTKLLAKTIISLK